MLSLSILARSFKTVCLINCTGRNWKFSELASKRIFLQMPYVSKVKHMLERLNSKNIVVFTYVGLICRLKVFADSAGSNWVDTLG